MVRLLQRLAVAAAMLHFSGCAVVQPESTCCSETCIVEDDVHCGGDPEVASYEPTGSDTCRHCGRGPSFLPLAHLFHRGRHHDVQPTPVEPSPTPAVWSRFHPVPTQPAFEPRPFYTPAMYGE